MGRPAYQRAAEATNLLTQAVFNGDAYEISQTFTLAQDESVTIHIDPTVVDSDGSTTFNLSGSPGTVYVPSHGEIYFRSNVPGSWTWFWE